jgi:hypothetical protein
MKEEMRISFNYVAFVISSVAIGGESCSAFSRGKCPSNKSPSEGFDNRRNGLRMQDSTIKPAKTKPSRHASTPTISALVHPSKASTDATESQFYLGDV